MQLDKDILAFDVETTGVKIGEARIIQIAIARLSPNANLPCGFEVKSRWVTYVNPLCEVSEKITELTGITNEHVKNAPTFDKIVGILNKAFQNCYLMSFNTMALDLPILAWEFQNCNVTFPSLDKIQYIDPYTLYCYYQPRTMSGAVRFYLGEERLTEFVKNAHDAMADVDAMVEVFAAQTVEHREPWYKADALELTPLPDNIAAVAEFCRSKQPFKNADYAKKLKWSDEGELIWNFGKHYGKAVTENGETLGFADWCLLQSFITEDTKNVLRMWLSRYENMKK